MKKMEGKTQQQKLRKHHSGDRETEVIRVTGKY